MNSQKNIVMIANNVGNIKDGVGVYAKNISEALENDPRVGRVVVFNGNTIGFGKIKKAFSIVMSMTMRKAIKYIKRHEVDYIMIEYPFMEYNPLIVIMFIILKYIAHNNNSKLVLSLHEYFRGKLLRRVTMYFMVMNSDVCFVTEKKIEQYFRQKGANVFTRNIANNIPISWENTQKNFNHNRKFVYFGLVIANKAFYEMIDAWILFNKNNKYTLDIITSTEIDDIKDGNEYGIKLHIGLDDFEVADLIKEYDIGIVPVKPYVGLYNSSFKTLSAAGCTSMGVFGYDFSNVDFIIRMNDYSTHEFLTAFKYAVSMDRTELEENAKKGILYAQEFTYENTCKKIMEYL